MNAKKFAIAMELDNKNINEIRLESAKMEIIFTEISFIFVFILLVSLPLIFPLTSSLIEKIGPKATTIFYFGFGIIPIMVNEYMLSLKNIANTYLKWWILLYITINIFALIFARIWREENEEND